MYYTVYSAPIGALYILEKDGVIIEVVFDDEPFLAKKQTADLKKADTPVLREAKKQLDEYFKGDRKVFDLPLKQAGSPFKSKCGRHFRLFHTVNQKAMQTLQKRLAIQRPSEPLDKPTGAMPCLFLSRVTGSLEKDRSLTGYAGTKTDMKAVLLELEGIPFVQK